MSDTENSTAAPKKNTLSIVSIVLSLVAIAAVILGVLYIKNNDTDKPKENNNQSQTPVNNTQNEQVSDTEISDNEARRIIIDYITYVDAPYESIEHFVENVEPDAKYEIIEPAELPGPVTYKYDVDYNDFVEKSNEYIDSSLTTRRFKSDQNKTGYYNCDGKLCFDVGGQGGGQSYIGKITFKKIATNEYQIEFGRVIGVIEMNAPEREEATFKFAPNNTGGFKIISIK